MKVSIILPAYNAEDTIQCAIQSIMRQTYKDYEVVAIDDGSSDKTFSILAAYQLKHSNIRLVKNDNNMGLIKTLNLGLDLAQGEYVVRMDADDVMEPNRLALQTTFMEAHPECVASGGQMSLFGVKRGNARIQPLEHSQIFNASFMMCPIYHPTAIVRMQFIRDHNIKYNEQYVYAEDYKLWSDILKIDGAKLANIPDRVLRYRTSSTQVSSAHAVMQFKMSCRIKRENINCYLISLGLSELKKTIDIDVIKSISRYISTHPDMTQMQYRNLILILCMMYMSLTSKVQRILHFVSSGDYRLYCNKIGGKWGMTILLSIIFPHRWKGYLV